MNLVQLEQTVYGRLSLAKGEGRVREILSP